MSDIEFQVEDFGQLNDNSIRFFTKQSSNRDFKDYPQMQLQ